MPAPVKPENRIDSADVEIAPVEEKDLLIFADCFYSSFPEAWFNIHEPVSKRPSYDVRKARFAKRSTPWISHPGLSFVKATIKSTGEIVGFTCWYKPASPALLNVFRRDVADTEFAKKQGWSKDEVDEMWEAVEVEKWQGEFAGYDRVRMEEMKDQPHWYLAPFFIFEQHRGRGIGSLLLKHASDQADAAKPPVPCYLEAFPDARPVYAHHGYTGREGPGRELVMIRQPRPSSE